jgi:hypothetical protein
MAQDMAAIEAEMGKPAQPVGQPQAVATPTVPAIEATPAVPANPAPTAPKAEATAPAQPAEQEPAVPEKFRGPDGKLDTAKLLKSYAEAEKGLKRHQNGQVKPAEPQAQPQAPATQGNVNLTPFELSIAQDLFNGGGYTEQQAISSARVLARLEETRHKALAETTLRDVNQVKEAIAFDRSQRELNELAKAHSWVLTPKGHDELLQVMNERPYAFENSPTPWADAVVILLGRKAISGQQGQVMPTPTGGQQTAQPLPASPAPVVTQPVLLNSKEQIEAHLKTLTPQQEDEFWKRNGFGKGLGLQPTFNSVIGTLTKPAL